MADTEQSLRAALELARPHRRPHGFPVALRMRVAKWALSQQASGVGKTALAKRLGVATKSLGDWLELLTPARVRDDKPRFLPVVIAPEMPRSPSRQAEEIVVHSPCGYRVAGLKLDELLQVLQVLG